MRDGQYVHTIIRMYYQQFNFSFAHVQFAIYSCRRNENQQQLADFCATLAANLKMILSTLSSHMGMWIYTAWNRIRIRIPDFFSLFSIHALVHLFTRLYDPKLLFDSPNSCRFNGYWFDELVIRALISSPSSCL